MLRLALLSLVGMTVLSRSFCSQEELEPNGSIAAAATARASLPVWPPAALCGESGGSDADFWRIPLDFHTNWLCEGEANFTLETEGPCRLTILSPDGVAGMPAYRVVGSWQSALGHIETGGLGVLYYWRFFDHLIAVVEVNGRRAQYRLTYW
jgi:hypothetical protein